MKRLLTAIVVIMHLLWSTIPITAQASSILQARSFRTNLVKGEYVDEEVLKPEESVYDEPIDRAEEIITDLAEIAGAEDLDEQEPPESDEHTDVSTPTDIESVVDEEPGELEGLEELIETDTKEPDETIEEYIGETEEEHETEVQSTQ